MVQLNSHRSYYLCKIMMRMNLTYLPSRKKCAILAIAGSIVMKGDTSSALDKINQMNFRSGYGKLTHLMQWLQPCICNAVCDLIRQTLQSIILHLEGLFNPKWYLEPHI